MYKAVTQVEQEMSLRNEVPMPKYDIFQPKCVTDRPWKTEQA